MIILFALLMNTFPVFSQEIRLTSAGDMIPHIGLQQFCVQTGDFDSLFRSISPEIKKSDIAIVNFESSMNTHRPISGYPMFNAHPEIMKALKNAGFTHLSLANNHSLDMGAEGLRQTVAHAEKNQLQQSGISLNGREYLKPLYFASRGIRFAFLSLTTITNGLRNPAGENTPKVFLLNKTNIKQVLRLIGEMKQKSDMVIIAIHYGAEYIDMPNNEQIYYSRILAEAGADIILGNHPHHIQKPAWINVRNNRKRTFVSYSQGNFISHQNRFIHPGNVHSPIAKRGDSFLMHIYIKKDTSGTYIQRVTYTPTWTLVLHQRRMLSYSVVILYREIKSARYPNLVSLFIQRRKRITEFLGSIMNLEEN